MEYKLRTVAVTGQMGAGKSTVLQTFHENNYPVCQADDIARSLLTRKSPCHKALKALFGSEFLLETGEWNRRALAREIFKNPEKRQKMEEIIHPLVQKEFEKFVSQWKAQGASLVFYELPLIAPNIDHQRFNFILFVKTNKKLTVQRLLKKGLSQEDIENRNQVQQPHSHLIKAADFILHNEGSFLDLKKKTEEVLKYILSASVSGKPLQRVL
ncbi:MAG: dephospho-CoA kinase [Bdellovibrionales bacterium]|nr:dephospho-CoA kinase [Bdellovibrionales bacterium]